MDANKLIKLKEIGYKIVPSCDLCKHSEFLVDEYFGVCHNHTYTHKKHIGPARPLSIHRCGVCKHYEYNTTNDMVLHGFRELLNTP